MKRVIPKFPVLGIISPLILLFIDVFYFLHKYPNVTEKYAGYINLGNKNLHLLTKDILDFRALIFVFLVFIPSILLSVVFAELYVFFDKRH